MTEKLLPCPFCGEDMADLQELSPSPWDGKIYWRVICMNCCCEIADDSRLKAVRTWNTRPSTQTTREFVDRLVRHQRLLKAKHWARSGWDGIPVEEVEEYRATYAAFTKVIEYIKAWDERMNK
jgi:hypothetical protein